VIAAQLSASPNFREVYRAWRLRIVADAFTAEEDDFGRQASSAMQRYLGLSPADASIQGRRAALFRRERLFHEVLLLDLDPGRLNELLDRVEVTGANHLSPDGRGVLLVALHYSLFSSLLCLWLARSAKQGLPPHLSIMVDTGPAPGLGMRAERLAALEASGLVARDRATLSTLDRPTAVLRTLTRRLREGAAVLLFVDANFRSATVGGGLPIDIGAGRIAFPAGVSWLADRTGCAVVPTSIRPKADGHTVVFSPPAASSEARAIRSALQNLINETVVADPGPWEGWVRVP
jgi:lauroyl/myristoyl acyltransferase